MQFKGTQHDCDFFFAGEWLKSKIRNRVFSLVNRERKKIATKVCHDLVSLIVTFSRFAAKNVRQYYVLRYEYKTKRKKIFR